MDFAQTIKSEHQRANDILERLADTSDGALKTRERLSSQLASLLEEHTRKEEAAFYPALAQHRDAHEKVGEFLDGAQAAHNEISRLATEINGMAKDDESFLARVNELRRTAHQHMREEERLLNPLRRALSEEETRSLDEAMAGGEEGEASQQDESMPAERAMEATGSAMRGGAATAAEGTRRVMREATLQSERSGRTVLAAAEIYSEAAQLTAEDLQAIATCSSIAAGGFGDIRQAWVEWLNRSLRATARASQDMLRCTTLDQLADVQRSFFKESFENLLQGSAEMLRISGRISEDARRPIEDRVSHFRDQPGRGGKRAQRGA